MCSQEADALNSQAASRAAVKQRQPIGVRNLRHVAVLLLAITVMFAATPGVWSASPRSLTGVVQTGGTSSSQPLPNANVTLFEATPGQPTAIGHATTDTAGRFTVPYQKSSSHSIFYVNADIGGGVEFVTILGSNLPASATINELTTVAASYSMAQFLQDRHDLG